MTNKMKLHLGLHWWTAKSQKHLTTCQCVWSSGFICKVRRVQRKSSCTCYGINWLTTIILLVFCCGERECVTLTLTPRLACTFCSNCNNLPPLRLFHSLSVSTCMCVSVSFSFSRIFVFSKTILPVAYFGLWFSRVFQQQKFVVVCNDHQLCLSCVEHMV